VDGKLNKEIANELGIDENTVESHFRNVFKKLGIRNRTELVARAKDGRLRSPTELIDGQFVSGEDLPLSFVVLLQDIDGHIWVVLEEVGFNRFYLQNPPAQALGDGNFLCTNILPGIRPGDRTEWIIHLVRVGSEAEARFRGMVAQWAFGAFFELPRDAKIVWSIRITRVTPP